MELLWLIRQREEEELFAFMSWFREEATDIIASERMIVRAFKGALDEKE